MVLTGATGTFSSTLAANAANDLYKLVRGLLDKEGMARREALANTVEPVFDAFRKIHDDYENTFREYRDELRRGEESLLPSSNLFHRVETDLNFGETQRVDLLALLRTVKKTELETFVTAIVAYLVSTEKMEEGSETVEEILSKPSQDLPQKYRHALITDLKTVTVDKDWTTVLDPYCSQPPLYGEDLERELAERRREHDIPDDASDWDIRLRQALAIELLDHRHRLMIDAYSKVSDEYQRLKRELLA